MKKRILSVLMLFVGILGVMAQQQTGFTPLPVMPGCKTGVLPNGLTYFVMHNSEPKERANFYIAQKVGSTLEEPNQLGLAHFLEHMCFNGTKHYPGKNMLNYLQSKGIRFGADINAYTGFDETVYNIDNIPTTDKALMDSVLLAVRDWSDGVLLEESEINAERGVIQEEWRSRNDAQWRQMKAALPLIYDEYQYEQLPIGTMDVVMNFKPEELRAYYKKWYRPDQQGIVVVGDFDVDEMEKKVIDMFSTVVMPADAAERKYVEVSNNEKPIFVSFEDPELENAITTISIKYDKTPFEMRNTVEAYVQDVMLQDLLSTLINHRLTEYTQDPKCAYAYAGVRYGDFYVSKTKGAFNIYIIPKGDTTVAMEEAMAIVARACKTGFTQSELERVNTEILANYEAMYNKRNKRTNESIAKELIRHFIDNEPAPGVETEYQLAQQVLPNIPVETINAAAAQIITPTNQVISVSQPKLDGMILPMEATFVPKLEEVLNADYEPYVDEVITDPLIAKMPKAGKIKSEKKNAQWGTTELTLSNGVKVIVKPTDFSDDQIVMQAFREGGKRAYDKSQAANILLVGDAVMSSKLGEFDANKLKKYMAGKRAGVGFEINNYTDVFEGSSTIKDLPTLMELVYANFTMVNPDEETYRANIERGRAFLANQDKSPEKIFQDKIAATKYPGNGLMQEVCVATLDQASYPEMLNIFREATANAADYTFVFVGNVDLDTLKPLLEQYIASLPSKGKPRKVKNVTSLDLARGDVNNEFQINSEVAAVNVYDVYADNNIPFSMENSVLMSLVGQMLDINYVETLREEEGGTYGASVAGFMNPNNNEWQVIYTFTTNEEKKPVLMKRAHDEFLAMLKNGANPDHFNKVRLATIKQLEIAERNNSFWCSSIFSAERGYDTFMGQKAFLENLSIDKMNDFMRKLYNGKNRIQVVMDAVAGK